MNQNNSTQTPNNLVAFCRSIVNLLRDNFKHSKFGRIILPFTSLSRLEGLTQASAPTYLVTGEVMGTASPKDNKEELLWQLINTLNELFVTDGLTDKDMQNYLYTVSNKVSENTLVMEQLKNNSPEQAILGDFGKAIDDTVMDISAAHQNQMMQLLSDPAKAAGFSKLVFDMLKREQ
jgi:type I restriction enzyme R subunit